MWMVNIFEFNFFMLNSTISIVSCCNFKCIKYKKDFHFKIIIQKYPVLIEIWNFLSLNISNLKLLHFQRLCHNKSIKIQIWLNFLKYNKVHVHDRCYILTYKLKKNHFRCLFLGFLIFKNLICNFTLSIYCFKTIYCFKIKIVQF